MKYIFDPDRLHAISKKGTDGKDLESSFNAILDELENCYPGKINREIRWLENIAGQALGKLAFLYATLSEYVIFFGTPFHVSSSHSGRYGADVWDFVFKGKMDCMPEGSIKWDTYGPGEGAHLERGMIKYYRTIDDTWMLEYGRGSIIGMLRFGVFGHMSITKDWTLTLKQIKAYGRLVLKNFFHK